jgi:23S rRNA (adenine-N6)-dimethyltransferase
VIDADALSYKLPEDARTIVGNIPFHLTTAILKKLLAAPHWQDAVLVVQWEVARRRAGVGGASMLTAQWWPWYRFQVHARIPAAAFRPAPSVDAGLLSMHRRLRPLVGELRADDRADSRAVLRADTRAADVGADARADVRSYQEFVRQIFTGRGPALAEILARSGRFPRRAPLQDWLRAEALPARALAKDLTAEQWAALWRLSAGGGRHNAALVSGRSGSGAAGSPRRGRRGA